MANAVTKAPIPGAAVKLTMGTQELGTANSDQNGGFVISSILPATNQPQNLTLLLEHPEFMKASHNLQAVGGKFTQQSYKLQLLPRELVHCRTAATGHCVVIGHFQPPLGATYTELSQRIANALTYDLLTKLQRLHLQVKEQPSFLACEEAKLRSADQGKLFAQALNADVFICGNVIQSGQQINLRTFVSDSYGLFEVPLSFMNLNVDLNDPGAAQMHPETHAAVLTALAAGYEKAEQFPQGIEATFWAERLLAEAKMKLPDLMEEIKKIRTRCQARLPHQGLLPGGGQ